MSQLSQEKRIQKDNFSPDLTPPQFYKISKYIDIMITVLNPITEELYKVPHNYLTKHR